MLLPGTEIHLVVFIITVLEIAFLLVQLIQFLSRPDDKKRLYFLWLILLTVYYNIVSGFLPDTNIPVDIKIQNMIAYTGGVFVSMYFPFFIFKVFSLKQLKRYAFGGSIIFLLLPFFLFFLLPYSATGNLDISRQLVVIIPFFYAISFLFVLTKAILFRYRKLNIRDNIAEIGGIYIAVLFWISLPIIVYFDGSQLLENSMTNAGLLVMIALHIKKSIQDSKAEFKHFTDLQSRINEITSETEKDSFFKNNAFENNCFTYNLTNREIEIIHLIAQGLPYKSIADKLNISYKTVCNHVGNIYEKVGVGKKAELLFKLEYKNHRVPIIEYL